MKKMSKKASVLATSVATIAVCASLAVGSTFALFTAEDAVDVTVSTGNVAVTATIVNQKVESPVEIDYATGEVVEDKGFKTAEGTALFSDKTLTVTKLLPGDVVTYDLVITNSGDVAAKYNYELDCTKGDALMSKFAVSVKKGETEVLTNETNMKKYTSAWGDTIEAKASVTYTVTMVLPGTVGNEYKNTEATFTARVNAVQANANVKGEAVVEYYIGGAEEFAAALENGGSYALAGSMELKEPANLAGNVSVDLDLNGNSVVSQANAFNLSGSANVTVSNGTVTSTQRAFNMSDNAALTLNDVNIDSKSQGVVSTASGAININGGKINSDSFSVYVIPGSLSYNYDGNPAYVPEVNVTDAEVGTKATVGFWTVATDLTIKDSKISVENPAEGSAGVFTLGGTTLKMSGCEVTCANGSGIQGNGTKGLGNRNCGEDANITLDNCTVTAGACALYLPQYGGTTTINGGTYTGGKSAIEIRAGKLVLNNATVTCTRQEFKAEPNGNGSTVFGAALAVSQHTTNDELSVTVNGCTLNGIYALYEIDKQDDEYHDCIFVNVADNKYNGYIYSENCANIKAIATADENGNPLA